MARSGPQKRQVTDPEELIRVWVTRVRSGATAAARAHGVDRATVYDLCARVDGDDALRGRAEAHLRDIRVAIDDRERMAQVALHDARIALYTQLRLRAGKLSPAQITAALDVLKLEAAKESGGSVVIQVPAELARERKDEP